MAPEEPAENPELAALREEVQRLRKYRAIVEGQTAVARGLTKLGILIWLGRDLVSAIKNWLIARRDSPGMPLEETAELFAAVLHRLIRVGFVAALLAIIPSALLIWQNLIMREQNRSLIQQIEEQRAAARNDQVSRHLEMLMSEEREKLWLAIAFFNGTEEARNEALSRLSMLLLESDGAGSCTALEALARLAPMSKNGVDNMPLRDVSGSLRPFLEYPEKIPLGGIEIQATICPERRFSQLSLSNLAFLDADFQRSEFYYVNLDGVRLSGADLRGVKFDYGIKWFSEEAGHPSDFSDADLSFASFKEAPQDLLLQGAKLLGTLFPWGPDLRTMPKSLFLDGICMMPTPAEACHRWYRDRYMVSEALIPERLQSPQPDGCPDPELIRGPIISAAWEVEECQTWLTTPE
ncbi:MAG: pentapeptide repeat-containing protein [Thermoanaerobaculia bacterium]|nr:pentapeptide repeat-containing protein [Thermoanaerobaculia bacterium]